MSYVQLKIQSCIYIMLILVLSPTRSYLLRVCVSFLKKINNAYSTRFKSAKYQWIKVKLQGKNYDSWGIILCKITKHYIDYRVPEVHTMQCVSFLLCSCVYPICQKWKVPVSVIFKCTFPSPVVCLYNSQLTREMVCQGYFLLSFDDCNFSLKNVVCACRDAINLTPVQ